jgi:hypothetical protein
MKSALALTAALALAGCAHAPAAKTSPAGLSASDYYPLAVGNAWTYDARMLGEQHVAEVRILRQANGFFEDSQGSKLAVDAEGLRDDKRYLLKNPLREGAEWDNVVSVSAREHYRIAQADAPCQVPAGSFQHCVTVESRTRTSQVTLINALTFAPGVGIVHLTVEAERNGQRTPQSELTLTHYALATPASAQAAAP